MQCVILYNVKFYTQRVVLHMVCDFTFCVKFCNLNENLIAHTIYWQLAARLPEDIKDAVASKGISFDLQSRSPLHDPPPHSSPLAHFTSQKAGGKCDMKARSGGSKKLPYLHPCHPVIFHPTFSAY